MRPLELDFQRARRPSQALQALLVAVALAFAGDVAWHYAKTSEELHRIRERLAQEPARRADDSLLVKVAARPVGEAEYAFARETIRRLATPWGTLFQALEAARIDGVAIASVEPDPAQRRVLIRGEARDYLAALSFVANLREQRALHEAHLVRHETASPDPRSPVQFVVSTAWGQGS